MGNHEHRAIALQHTSGSAIVRDYCADLEARIRSAANLHGAIYIQGGLMVSG